jgi:rubrerythrin
MTDTSSVRLEPQLLAELNDLLQLDYDAVQAYTVAIERLKDADNRNTLASYREDHERHIRELSQLIRSRGGDPINLPHLPTGVFKLAVQGAGAAGGDKGLLLAFKSNERQVRDKYRRAANRAHDPEVSAIIRRAADDEQRHYSWALERLEDMGAGVNSTLGRAENAFEVGHARMADAVEHAEKRAMEAGERAKRGIGRMLRDNPAKVAAIAIGAGAAVAGVVRSLRNR